MCFIYNGQSHLLFCKILEVFKHTFVSVVQERDFDKHVTYCRDEPAAQDFLMENEEARDFFEVSDQINEKICIKYLTLYTSNRNSTNYIILVVSQQLIKFYCT